jgi:hypothetical protein
VQQTEEDESLHHLVASAIEGCNDLTNVQRLRKEKIMRVTIVLETGGVFPREQIPQAHLDIGYFRTPGPSDIEVSEDGNPAKGGKLPDGIINVEHLEADGALKQPVTRSAWFELDLLRKDDLYPPAERPDFIADAYDCILHFMSGDFNSADVRGRRFTQHLLQGGAQTGERLSRAIANEIHVEYDIADGEVLRLRGPNGDVWSSSSVGRGTQRVIVKLKTHPTLKPRYHIDALDHKGSHYYLPNSDPPPMNGNNGG